MKLGKFTRDSIGDMHGRIFGLGLPAIPVLFEPQTSKKNGAPYFRIIANPVSEAYEIGAAFERQKDGVTYYTVSLDSPAFVDTVNAVLFPDREMPGQFNLFWERPEQYFKSKPEVLTDATPGLKLSGAVTAP